MQAAQLLLIPGAGNGASGTASAPTGPTAENATFGALMQAGQPAGQDDGVAQTSPQDGDSISGDTPVLFVDLGTDVSEIALIAAQPTQKQKETATLVGNSEGENAQVLNVLTGEQPLVAPVSTPAGSAPLFVAGASTAVPGNTPVDSKAPLVTGAALDVAKPTQAPVSTAAPVLVAAQGNAELDASSDTLLPPQQRRGGDVSLGNAVLTKPNSSTQPEILRPTLETKPQTAAPVAQPLQDAAPKAQTPVTSNTQVAPTLAEKTATQVSIPQVATTAATSVAAVPVAVKPEVKDQTTPAQRSVTTGAGAATAALAEGTTDAANVTPRSATATTPVTDRVPLAGQEDAPVIQAKSLLRKDPTHQASAQPTFLTKPATTQVTVAPELQVGDDLPEGLTRAGAEALPATPTPRETAATTPTNGLFNTAKPTLTKPFSEALMMQVKAAEVVDGRTTVQLRPEGLGSIDVEVFGSDAELASKIVVRVENPVILQHLRDDRDLLAQAIGVSDSSLFEFEQHDTNQQSGGKEDSFGGLQSDGVDGGAKEPNIAHTDILTDDRIDIMT